MYEYIFGKRVQHEEHMLSAREIAQIYGFYTLKMAPNGAVVRQILSSYLPNDQYKYNHWYYECKHGVMEVYPRIFWKTTMNRFIKEQLKDTERYQDNYEWEENRKIRHINYIYVRR